MTLSRQDSAGTGDGLLGLGARNTLPHSGHRGHRGHRPGADISVARSMSVPPKSLHHTLTKPDHKVNYRVFFILCHTRIGFETLKYLLISDDGFRLKMMVT